jgi:hypothetical protein
MEINCHFILISHPQLAIVEQKCNKLQKLLQVECKNNSFLAEVCYFIVALLLAAKFRKRIHTSRMENFPLFKNENE